MSIFGSSTDNFPSIFTQDYSSGGSGVSEADIYDTTTGNNFSANTGLNTFNLGGQSSNVVGSLFSSLASVGGAYFAEQGVEAQSKAAVSIANKKTVGGFSTGTLLILGVVAIVFVMLEHKK